MIRQTLQMRVSLRLIGQSCLPLALGTLLACVLFSPIRPAWAESQDSGNGSTLVTETTITEITTTEVSDRESRLRNMEDEILKQLSVGDQPSAQDGKKPSLTDIKHVSDEVTAPQSTTPKTPIETQDTTAARAKVSVVEDEEISTSLPRSPRAASVVPVSAVPVSAAPAPAKSAPTRKSSVKKYTPSKTLTAKDLEHRMAITETQLNLLTQELESTKNKLATAESRVRELTYQLEDGAQGSNSQSDTTGNVETRAAAVMIAEPSNRRSVGIELARLTKNKAPLRIGPGPRESIITHLARDSVVSIEHRTSGWYRVVTSDGARGWLPGTYLVFDTDMYSGSTVHVGAFEPRLEPTSGRY